MDIMAWAIVAGAAAWLLVVTGILLPSGFLISWLLFAVLPPVIALGILWVKRGKGPQ